MDLKCIGEGFSGWFFMDDGYVIEMYRVIDNMRKDRTLDADIESELIAMRDVLKDDSIVMG